MISGGAWPVPRPPAGGSLRGGSFGGGMRVRLLWVAGPMGKLRRNAPIRSWEAGDNVQGFALLTKKELRQDRNGRGFLDLELADSSGSMVAKVWADSPALSGQFEAHEFVAFKGSVKSYKDQLQASIDECRTATEDDRRFGFD